MLDHATILIRNVETSINAAEGIVTVAQPGGTINKAIRQIEILQRTTRSIFIDGVCLVATRDECPSLRATHEAGSYRLIRKRSIKFRHCFRSIGSHLI